MIFVDDSTIKIGGIVLPGLFKSMEIKADASVEEQDVQGSSKKPKQATGYEDAKITLELILLDAHSETKEQKLLQIQNLFKKSNQAKPEVHQIVNEHTAIRGVNQVILKSLSTKLQNKNDELSVSIELWEYVPVTIVSTKNKKVGAITSNKSSASAPVLDINYQTYLAGRGKTTNSPAKDTENNAHMRAKLDYLPF